MTKSQQISNFEKLGGDAVLRKIVDLFYGYMDTLPETQDIRDLHPKELNSSREKLFMFLSGWLEGPDRYIAAFGHPRLRARHLPFKIGDAEREQWMLCMTKAFHDVEMDSLLRDHLLNSLARTATHMINQQA